MTTALCMAASGGGGLTGASAGGTGGGGGGANRRSDRSTMCSSWYMSCLGPRPPTCKPASQLSSSSRVWCRCRGRCLCRCWCRCWCGCFQRTCRPWLADKQLQRLHIAVSPWVARWDTSGMPECRPWQRGWVAMQCSERRSRWARTGCLSGRAGSMLPAPAPAPTAAPAAQMDGGYCMGLPIIRDKVQCELVGLTSAGHASQRAYRSIRFGRNTHAGQQR